MVTHKRLLTSLALQLTALGGLQAQTPLRVLYPQQVAGNGNGWTVDPAVGRLGMTVPVATVGGEMPIPVTFRYSACHTQEVHQYSIVSDTGKVVVVKTAIQRPIFGTLHFGFISDGTIIDPESVSTRSRLTLQDPPFQR